MTIIIQITTFSTFPQFSIKSHSEKNLIFVDAENNIEDICLKQENKLDKKRENGRNYKRISHFLAFSLIKCTYIEPEGFQYSGDENE